MRRIPRSSAAVCPLVPQHLICCRMQERSSVDPSSAIEMSESSRPTQDYSFTYSFFALRHSHPWLEPEVDLRGPDNLPTTLSPWPPPERAKVSDPHSVRSISKAMAFRVIH